MRIKHADQRLLFSAVLEFCGRQRQEAFCVQWGEQGVIVEGKPYAIKCIQFLPSSQQINDATMAEVDGRQDEVVKQEHAGL